MNNQSFCEADWKPCPAQEISAFIHRIRRRRRATIAMRVGASAAVVLFVTFLVPYVSSLRSQIRGDTAVSGFTCREVEGLAAEYLAGSLAPQVRNEIDKHLAECAGCYALINGLRQEKTMRLRDTVPYHESSRSL